MEVSRYISPENATEQAATPPLYATPHSWCQGHQHLRPWIISSQRPTVMKKWPLTDDTHLEMFWNMYKYAYMCIFCIYNYNYDYNYNYSYSYSYIDIIYIYIRMCVCSISCIANIVLNVHRRYRSAWGLEFRQTFTSQTEAEEHKNRFG